MIRHFWLQIVFNFSAFFNCEIGNTEARIELPAILSRHDRLGRTGIDAPGTSPAPVRRGPIRSNWDRYQDLAQKKPGALFLIDQASILSDPTKPGRFGIRALQK